MSEASATQAIEKDAHLESKWSWYFPFLSVSYAGRGQLGAGLALAVFNFIPLTFIISGLALKSKTKKLYSEVPFKWNAGTVFVLIFQLTIWLVILSMAKK